MANYFYTILDMEYEEKLSNRYSCQMVVNYYPSRSHLSKDRVDYSTLTLIHFLRMVTGFAGH